MELVSSGKSFYVNSSHFSHLKTYKIAYYLKFTEGVSSISVKGEAGSN